MTPALTHFLAASLAAMRRPPSIGLHPLSPAAKSLATGGARAGRSDPGNIAALAGLVCGHAAAQLPALHGAHLGQARGRCSALSDQPPSGAERSSCPARRDMLRPAILKLHLAFAAAGITLNAGWFVALLRSASREAGSGRRRGATASERVV